MEEERRESERKSVFFAVAVLECVLAVLIIAGVLAVKLFAPATYTAARQWYKENAAADTDVKGIINGVPDEI